MLVLVELEICEVYWLEAPALSPHEQCLVLGNRNI